MLPLSEEDAKILKEILSDLAELTWEQGGIPLGGPAEKAQAAEAEIPAGE
ncbi:MAG TPA: hypothetical protein VM599_00140 [Thermoanaerobaculia bacterium]|nr:hypothetical protein [Thermoanaerobaculia bacterium]